MCNKLGIDRRVVNLIACSGSNLTRAAFAFWFVNFKQYAICRLNLAVYLNFTAGSYFTLGITRTFTKLTKFDLFFASVLRSHDEALW
nr:hypothetical protein [uncultured Campylobacter sp.]